MSKQRTSKDDPNFVDGFFQNSRLHFIGVWKERYDELLDSLDHVHNSPPSTPPKGYERVLFHVDMDCFFAAVAALGHPELQNKPLAICHGSGNGSGSEVSTCNYLARACGVRRGISFGKARMKCPDLMSRPYEYERYAEIAEQMYRCLFDTTPFVHGLSCDEALLDMTLVCHEEASANGVRGQAEAVAKRLRAAIFLRTGCNASIGIGSNRLLARVALARAKPDNFYHLRGSSLELQEMLDSQMVSQLPQVGPSTRKKLAEALEIELPTVCDVRRHLSKAQLMQLLGHGKGSLLWDHLEGVDDRKWEVRERKTMATQISWGVRFDEDAQVTHFMAKLADAQAARMEKASVKGQSISLKLWRAVADAPDHLRKGSVGHGVCDQLIRSLNVLQPTSSAYVITATLTSIWRAMRVDPSEVRGMGVMVGKLQKSGNSRVAAVQTSRPIAALGNQSTFNPADWNRSRKRMTSSSSSPSDFFSVTSKNRKRLKTCSIELRQQLLESMGLAETALMVGLNEESPIDAVAALTKTSQIIHQALGDAALSSSVLNELQRLGDRWALLGPVDLSGGGRELRIPAALHLQWQLICSTLAARLTSD